jgi:enterochelin esterase-like enzyme
LDWISKEFPRFVIIEIQHANPFYDDSYAVNSANLGPYGDAINYELIPFIEKQFRCIGQGWARFTYGGSTGGWEALATQMFYPDMYNGCFACLSRPH